MRTPVVLLLLTLAFTSSAPLEAQGRGPYMNVESPQVHPIEVATIGGHDYLLVTNTPDHAIEIWDTDESIPLNQRFLKRVRTGLEPVSVRWVPSRARAFVANFLGDSITEISITASDGPATISAFVVRTESVTDEPLDLAFADVDNGDGTVTPTLFVTHMTLDAWSRLDARTLQPVGANDENKPAEVASGQDLDFDTVDDFIALKEPWTPAVFCDRLFILGHKGGNSARYDFDLYVEPLAGGTPTAIANVGSTNWNMTFGADGHLYVVGAQSRNKNLLGESQVAAAKSGFVKSMFYLIENPCDDDPVIHRRDINLRRFSAQIEDHHQQAPGSGTNPVTAKMASGPMSPGKMVVVQPATSAVPKSQALAQPTDLVVFDVAGEPTKVFFTAYGSDRVGVIEPSTTVAPINWPRRAIDLTPVTPGAMAGARGIALRPASDDGSVPARLYVLNRIDPSVSVLDPVNEVEVPGASFALNATNIEPDEITKGRRFLYDARLSGKGFVSCASCHPDARTDGQSWKLDDGSTPMIPEEIDQVNQMNFPGDKGFMVTQSLQGLLNFEVPPDIQDLFSNKPYHWRGDREDFQAFNGAFSSLLGGSILGTQEIADYEEFINTVHYPPNPNQGAERRLSGALGSPDEGFVNGQVAFEASGSGGLKGLKLYHIARSDSRGPCSGCHQLPEGSDNVLSENIGSAIPFPLVTPPPQPNAPNQPIETAALRGLLQKEARRDTKGSDHPMNSAITGYEGLFHTGVVNSGSNNNDFNGTSTVNAFNLHFFDGRYCTNPAANLPSFCDNIVALNTFVREMDWGAGPLIGESLTVTRANRFTQPVSDAFKAAETEAGKANAGAVVQARIAGTERGFWYDLTGNAGPPTWVEEPGGATFDSTGLQNLLSSNRDRLIILSTPLGSERRIADPSGQPTLQVGNDPSAAELLGMVPNTAYEDIPALSEFVDTGSDGHGGGSLHTMRLYQKALLADAVAENGFGLCQVRHEAPRRFRLKARGLRHGATLTLWVPAGLGMPDDMLGPEESGQAAMRKLVLPLHPTAERVDGLPVWQTAVEADPRLVMRLLAGPPINPTFQAHIADLVDLDHNFDIPEQQGPPWVAGDWAPASYNLHFVRVSNTDQSFFDADWQALTIEPGPLCP